MSQTIVYSSSQLPDRISERAKFSLWQDLHNEHLGSFECMRPDTLPFTARIEAKSVGALKIWQMAGTINHASRLSRNIAEDSRDDYYLLINKTDAACTGFRGARQYDMGRGDAVLLSAEDPMRISGGDSNVWANIVLPRSLISIAFRNVEDQLATPIRAGHEALGLLGGYLGLLDSGPSLTSPAMAEHATRTIVDLVGLALGARGDDAEIARLRGLRAARLQAVLANLRGNFLDPAVSARMVARQLGLSTRYVHDLLEETGISFTARVSELRMQQALSLLTDRLRGERRISDIAFSCGFNDISHFNRTFRRRFGCTPGSVR